MEGPNARALNLAAILPVFSLVALPALHSTRSRDPRAPLKWLLHDSWDLAVTARSIGGSSAGLSSLKGPSFTLSTPKGLELGRFFTHGTKWGGVSEVDSLLGQNTHLGACAAEKKHFSGLCFSEWLKLDTLC